MAIQEILLLGNPKLLEKSEPVRQNELEFSKSLGEDLRDTMVMFREKHGWGRSIAAPQIGIMKQIIFMEVDNPTILINPVISEQSSDMIELWDDCMSFPPLLVKVRRYSSCRLSYRDAAWQKKSVIIEGKLAELLQHEIDHLNGVLAPMRAIDGKSFALQSQKHLLGSSAFANPET